MIMHIIIEQVAEGDHNAKDNTEQKLSPAAHHSGSKQQNRTWNSLALISKKFTKYGNACYYWTSWIFHALFMR